MQSITIRELHERTGAWVRRAAQDGAVLVTDHGRPVARIDAPERGKGPNPFKRRRLRPGYARLLRTVIGGRDSTDLVSDDRDRP